MDSDSLVSLPDPCLYGNGARAIIFLALLYVAVSLGPSGPCPAPADLMLGASWRDLGAPEHRGPFEAFSSVGGPLLTPCLSTGMVQTFPNVAEARLE
jgi:hypothetical protein